MSAYGENIDVVGCDQTDVKSDISMRNTGQILNESLNDNKEDCDHTKDSALSDLHSTIEDGFFFKKSRSNTPKEIPSMKSETNTGTDDGSDHRPGKYAVKMRNIPIPEDDFAFTAPHRHIDKISDQAAPASNYREMSATNSDTKRNQLFQESCDSSLASMSHQSHKVSVNALKPGTISRMSEISKDSSIKESGRGNSVPVSDGNLEKANNDVNPNIPSKKLVSPQSSFKEQINTNGSLTKPTLTRSNSKPLCNDTVKFRRNLELWGERNEPLSSRCESIADLRTSTQCLSRDRIPPITSNLSPARSTVSLSRVKADVGGLVSKWESGKTKNSSERFMHSSALNLTLPISELREKIKPKPKSPTPRVVLAKAGFKDVRQQWETKSSAQIEDYNSELALTSKALKVRSASTSDKMLLHSPNDGITRVSQKSSGFKIFDKLYDKSVESDDKNDYSGKVTLMSSNSDLSKMSMTSDIVSDMDKLYDRKTVEEKHSSHGSLVEDNPIMKKSDDKMESSSPVVRSALTSPIKTDLNSISCQKHYASTEKSKLEIKRGKEVDKDSQNVNTISSLAQGLTAKTDNTSEDKEVLNKSSPGEEARNTIHLESDKNERENASRHTGKFISVESKISISLPPKVLPKSKSRVPKTDRKTETCEEARGPDNESSLFNNQAITDSQTTANINKLNKHVFQVADKDNKKFLKKEKSVSNVSPRSPVTHSDLISKFEQGIISVKTKDKSFGIDLIKRDNVKIIARAHDDQSFIKQRTKSQSARVIPKRGFESIRNNWEGKTSDQRESNIQRTGDSEPPIPMRRNTRPKNFENKQSELSLNKTPGNVTDSFTQHSGFPDPKKSHTSRLEPDESISGTKTDSGQSDLEKTFSDSSETQRHNMSESSVGPPETLSSLSDVPSGSDSEESGGQFSDAEDVFSGPNENNVSTKNQRNKGPLVRPTEDRTACDHSGLSKGGNGTVRAKVVKIVADSRDSPTSPPKSPHAQTFRAKKCATYVEKVVNSGNSNRTPIKSKSTPLTRHESREERVSSPSRSGKISTETSASRRLQFSGNASQDSSRTNSPSGRKSNQCSPVEKRSFMRPKFKKSPSVPEGQDIQKKPLISKNSAPNLTKSRKTSSSSKLNTSFDDGQKQRNYDRRSGIEKSPREKNIPSVFERLHANQPVRKTPSVRDLCENEQPKLRKSVSRSSLRRSGNSSSLKPKSSSPEKEDKEICDVPKPSTIEDSEKILKTNLNDDDDSAFSEPQETDLSTAEPQCQNGHCSSGNEKEFNNAIGEKNSENNNHKAVTPPQSTNVQNIDRKVETVTRPSPKPRKRNLVKLENEINAKSHDTNISVKNGENIGVKGSPKNPDESQAVDNGNFTRSEQRRSRRRILRESESVQIETIKPKDTDRTEGLNETNVKSGGRSRSTNGSIASTSSSTDIPKGGRSGQDGQKQNLGLEQKIINIDFESKPEVNGVDAAPQNKETESVSSVPKEKQIAPEFIIKPRRQLADEGEGAKFKASFEGLPEPTLTWQFNGKDLVKSNKFKIYQKDDFHFLEIESVCPEDAGKYTCLIQNQAGEATLTANLEVFAAPKSTKSKSTPPVIETELKDVVAREGDRNVGLECKVKVTTDAEVTWYHNGFVIKSGRDYRTGFDGTVAKLHFYELKAEYEGEYECVVKTAAGKAKSSGKLTVKSAQEVSVPPKFTQQLKNQTLQDGERLIFHAIVTGNPEPTVKWYRNKKELQATEDVLISFDGTNAKLQIEDVLPEDSAEFTCKAQNEAGEATTKATLTVIANESTPQTKVKKEPPRFLRELKNIEVKDGDRVEMVVEVEGTQPIEVIWVLNDKEIPLNSKEFAQISDGCVHKLIIDEVFPEDSGRYSCEVFNDFGDIESCCTLCIKDTAEVQGPPQFITKPASVQMDEGQAVSFTCQVSGNPAPSVEWEINGKPVVPARRVRVSQNEDEYRLDIPHCMCGDSGRYTCVVTNKNGTVTHTASLNVTPSENTDSQEQTDFRSLLKSRPGLASIGSQDSTESVQSVQSEKSDKVEVEQHDFRKALTRQVETKQRPKFRSLLQDQKIKEGGEVTLKCEVKGVPTPEVSWSVNGKPIKESKYFRMMYEEKLATLVMAEAYPEDEGQYMCTAENVAGSASCACDLYIEASASDSNKLSSSKSGELEAPRILEFDPTSVSVKKGKSVKIRCRISGEPEPKIMWFHNKSSVKQDDHIKIEKRRDVSTLSISNILPSDGGKYILVIENSVGSLDAVASVSVEDVPNPPAGKPHVSMVTKTTIILAWYGPAYDGGSQITNYRVEICKAKDQIWKTLTSACKNTSYEATNLITDTEYQFRVSAGNKHGLSDAGQVSDPVLTTDNYKSEPESDGLIPSPTLARLERDELPFEPREVKISTERLFEDEFDIKEELGKGKFGYVHRCIQKSSGLSWAAKIIKCREKDKPTIRQEIEVMNCLQHPKLLMLWDAFESPKAMVLIMEYIAGGELFERIIDDEFVLTERDCVHFMRQICDGVCYMHDHNILHLDLKPENILCISPNSNLIKIIDFGLARPYHPGESTKVMLGTPEFIAPEVINYDEIGFTTDMWSLGVLCYVLLSGLSPFLGDSDPETLVNVTVGEIDFDDDAFEDISRDAKEFIEKLVVKNKEKRMTVHQCLKHKWLAQDVKRLRLKRLNTRNLKQFLARRKWQVDQMLDNFRRLREDLGDDSDTELETKRRPLVSAHSKDSGIGSYKDRDTYSSLTDYSAGGGTLEFLEEMADVEAMSSDVALFKVCVTGRPEPTIEWSHCNSEITPSRRFIMDLNEGGEYSLKIKNITEKDGGEYRCTASSSAGQVSCAANLTVLSL